MSDTLKFKGTWNPSLGAFPVITDDTVACYYLVSGAGHVDGYDFNEGDWLIYVEEPISPTETHGKWYRAEGGIVQVAPLQQEPQSSHPHGGPPGQSRFNEPGTYTKVTVNNAGRITQGDFLTATDIPPHSQDASTIAGFIPAARTAVGPMFVNTARSKAVEFSFDESARTVSADVRVDGLTIVKDEFGQLKVADSIAHAGGGVVDPGDGDMLFPPEAHKHVSADITDFQAAVRHALAHSPNGQNVFFSNTARTSAVVFNYDLSTSTVSADVKVDNSTIVKNKYGQLVAVAADLRPHTHTIDEIIGISIDDIKNLRPASEQRLKEPTDGSYQDGLHNLIGQKISDAFDLVNVSLKDLTSRLIEINTDVAAIRPVPPPSLDTIELKLWSGHQSVTASQAGTGNTVAAILSRFPRTEITARFAGSSKGSLIALIDGVSSAPAARIEEEGDYYAGEPAFQGWYTSIRASIRLTYPLSAGEHTLQLRYTDEKGNISHSSILTCYVAVAQTNSTVDLSRFNIEPSPDMSNFVSGVPSLVEPNIYFKRLFINFAVGKYYKPHSVVSVYGGNPGLVDDETLIGDPANIPDVDGIIEINDIDLHFKNEYASPITIETVTHDLFENNGRIAVFEHLPYRIDPSDEIGRVLSGHASDLYPPVGGDVQCGGTWDATQSLVSGIYTSELQLINNRYRWPDGDFTAFGGPNYTNAFGVRISNSDDTRQYRWVTKAYDINNLIAFDLHFERMDENEWPLTFNKTIKDMFIFGKVIDQTEWVDFNKPFRGFGGVSALNDGALDVSKTTSTMRRITFGAGAGPFTGTLLIRIGFSRNTGYELDADISLVPAGY